MRRKLGVSPLLGIVLLVSMVFVLGIGVSMIAERVGGPNLQNLPDILLQIWRNFPGRGAIGVVNVTGKEIGEAFYADFLMDTELGSLFENVKWKNLEVRINGLTAENDLEYVLYVSPLTPSLKVKNSLLPFPSGGGMVVFSYRQGFLKEGDRVTIIHKPSTWTIANTIIAPPWECTEIGSTWVRQNLVDSCISLRALQLRTLEREMVNALSPSIEVRYNENYRWYKEDFDRARSYIPRIENLAGEIQLLLNSCKGTGGYLDNDMRVLDYYLDMVSERDYYKLCIAYKSWDQARRGIPKENRLLYLVVNGLELIYNMENPIIRAWDPSYVSTWQTTGPRKGTIENVAENITKKQLLPLIGTIENLLTQPPYPGIPVEALTYFGVSPEMDDLYEDFYRPAIVPVLKSYRWVDNTTFEFVIHVYNVGGENANNFTRYATLWYSTDNAWWVSKYFKRAKDLGYTGSEENMLYVFPENWLVPMENKFIATWGTRVYDNSYHNTYRYTTRLRLENWWATRPGLQGRKYLENLSPELVFFGLQVPYYPDNGNVVLYARLENRPEHRTADKLNLAPGTYWVDNIRITPPKAADNRIWLEDYYFFYQHPKTGEWEWQYFWNIHWSPGRPPPGGSGGGGGC